MAVQTQQEEKRADPFDQEEEPAVPQRKETSAKKQKPRRNLPLALGIFLCIAALVTGRYLRSNTTLFLEQRNLEGYLPVEEYVFRSQETGTPVQNPRTFHFDSYYVYNTRRPMYETSRGIRPGDSWETFVEAYGDETMSYVYTNRYDEKGDINWDYSGVYLNDPITVREFDETYVKTGKVDLAKDSITLSFILESDGVNVYYSWDEAWDEFSHNRLRHIFSQYPNTKSFCLSFTFEPDLRGEHNGSNTLDMMSSTYY